jgi:hypothetical protein
MMKTLYLAIAIGGFAVAGPVLAQDETSSIIGAWRMTSLEITDASGQTATVPYSGQVIFTEAGTLSVQAMNPDTSAPDNPYTLNGYEAYYGPVTVNEAEGTFVIEVESAAVRNLIGQRFERMFEVTGDQLVLTPANAEEGWRVTYERY